MARYSLGREPRDKNYRDLLEFCASRAPAALLVVREVDWLDEAAIHLLERLRLFQTAVQERSEWPGTRLLNDTATVYQYVVQTELVTVLQSVAHGLYDWRQPQRPEDLCFVRATGTPLLVSIAHEHDGYLDLDGPDEELLRSKYPSLTTLLEPD